MSHSNSSLNCFASCMSKYKHAYILHTTPDKKSPHLEFGVMAHDTLYKAGKLRDEVADGVVNRDEYYSIIPSEVLYPNLKEEFDINNWEQYFMPIIKQTAKYEQELIALMAETHEDIKVEREIKLSLSPEQLAELGYYNIKQPLVGIIDCLIYCKDAAIILDYKFSSSKKTQDDFDMNSQLPLYALLVHTLYDIPLHEIQYGYIDIPKQMFGKPTILTNGTLSRSKSQNVSQEMYEKAVEAIHPNDEYYNCKPGGYYYDCWCNLALNKCAYLSIQYLDMEVYTNVTHDLMKAAQMVDKMEEDNMEYLRKYDAYTCKGCEYLTSCKPWLTVTGE